MGSEIAGFNFDCFPSGVSSGDLNKLEAELGGKLDRDFRAFIGKINGGRPDPALVSKIPLLPYPIIVFLGLDESKSNLLRDYQDLKQIIGRSDLLPIAYDTSLSRICLDIGKDPSPIFRVQVDDLYGREPLEIKEVCDSFTRFWKTLSQPLKLIGELEALAQRSWSDIETVVNSNPRYYLASPSDELSLLCQVIRAENDEAFHGLVDKGANLENALRIAVSCERFDYVEKLVESGACVDDAIAYAVGPSRKKIRDYLENRLSKH